MLTLGPTASGGRLAQLRQSGGNGVERVKGIEPQRSRLRRSESKNEGE